MTVVSSTRSARTIQQLLEDAAAITLPALQQAVDGLPQGIRHVAGVHFGWWDRSGVPTAANGNGGKAVRAALALLSCQAAGGGPAAGVPAAVAVELVHNASLLHDDIIDGDRLRRGRPALWDLLGVPAAILAGDALFFLAVRVLAEALPPLSGAAGVGQLTAAVQELIEGEYADTCLQDHRTASVAECAAMAAGKTGALFAVACTLGALLAGADEERTARLRAFGTHLGAAFQLADDLIGIWGNPQHTGKPTGSDLASRKKTLPIAAALASDGAAGQELVRLYARPEPFSPAELAHLAHLVQEAGGRAWAVKEAERHTMQALEHLRAARPLPGPAQELATLAQLAATRDQ